MVRGRKAANAVARRLIACSDGTWNTPEQNSPTNVVKISRAITPTAPDGTSQIVFYDPGVGTDNLLDKFSGGAFGLGISKNVQDAYRFLVHNYTDGDEIYLFGCSRGAYTSRSAAGLIRKCGLLRKQHAGRLKRAFQIYRKRDADADTPEAIRFRQSYSHNPLRIKFIGVWDTVGALGIPLDPLRFLGRNRFEFHDVRLSRSVDYAYHAVAIDERRGPFEATLWEQHPEATKQVVEQVWFSGVHMDVGGGYDDDGLSDLALVWMIDKARETGLAFDEEYVRSLRPDGRAPLHDSRTFLYRLLGPRIRSIGTATCAHESVHAAACDRRRGDLSYHPTNLEDYVRRHGSC